MWTDNRKDLAVGIVTKGLAVVIFGLIAFGRDRIKQFLQRLFFPEFRSQEEKLSQAEKTCLENVIARLRFEESWHITKYTDLNAVFQDLEMK